jgi:succinoglycan biosynthesis transport protein ExoP
VLVLSADLRNPSIHELFDVPLGPGLADVLGDSDERTDIEAFRTNVRGVRLVPSGVMEGDPGELLASARMARLLEAAGRMADVVILDTSPVLVASGVTALLTKVDAVVLVARANETRPEFADRAGDVLRRLRAPVVGLALNCAREISIRSSYGRSYVREARRQRSRKEAEVG